MSAPMSPERLAEARALLRYESSIAFYSARAKESMLLLLAEAEEAARLRSERDEAVQARDEAVQSAVDGMREAWASEVLLLQGEIRRLRSELKTWPTRAELTARPSPAAVRATVRAATHGVVQEYRGAPDLVTRIATAVCDALDELATRPSAVAGCECEPMQLTPDEYMHHPACPTRQDEKGGDGRG